MGGVAIHAMLCHTDDVLLFQYVEGQAGVDHTSWVGTWNWRTGQTAEAPLGYDRDIFCSGHNTLADGRVFVAGGHDFTTGKKIDAVGVAECDIYDPATRTWTRVPPLTEKRWYPTNVGLPNGRTLIFGGLVKGGTKTTTVDEYDAMTDTMRRLPSSADKPLGSYPRVHLLPNGKILRSGPSKPSLWFNPATASWASAAPLLYGARTRGSAVLLPGADRMMAVGGGKNGSPTPTVEILDTSASTLKWRYTGSLSHGRLLQNTTMLPDGSALAIGGGLTFKYTDPVFIPELWDPATETWTPMAPQKASRMYHSTALLLPDGRVLSAGQDSGLYGRYGEIYSPPYLFRGARPVVSGVPSQASNGGQLQFASPDAATLDKVVLARPGSATHEVDTDQRNVPLAFQVSGTTVTAQVPANVNQVPPGYWMLFAINNNGVPAVAPWVHIG
jgi:hypothetical protein